MRDVVEFMFFQELSRHEPRTIGNDLVDPFAVAEGLRALGAAKNSEAFSFMRLVVAGDAHDEVDIREGLLGLFELAHVTTESVPSRRTKQGENTPNETNQTLHPHKPAPADPSAASWYGIPQDPAARLAAAVS